MAWRVNTRPSFPDKLLDNLVNSQLLTKRDSPFFNSRKFSGAAKRLKSSAKSRKQISDYFVSFKRLQTSRSPSDSFYLRSPANSIYPETISSRPDLDRAESLHVILATAVQICMAWCTIRKRELNVGSRDTLPHGQTATYNTMMRDLLLR